MAFLNNEMRFYEIDSRVYFHETYKKYMKPYVGSIVTIDNVKYFIPLTSAKTKHTTYRLMTKDYLLIYDIVDINSIKDRTIYKEKGKTLSKFHCNYIELEKAMLKYHNESFKKHLNTICVF